MKLLSCGVILALLILTIGVRVYADDSWNVQVKSGPETRPLIPVDLNLTVEDFTVSSPAQISNMAFNATISQLSLEAAVTDPDEGNGYNVIVVMPSAILANSRLIFQVAVDGKPNGYAVINASTIGLYLYVGTHTVTVDIYDPPVAAPEFSVMILPLFALTLLAVIILKVRARPSTYVDSKT